MAFGNKEFQNAKEIGNPSLAVRGKGGDDIFKQIFRSSLSVRIYKVPFRSADIINATIAVL